MKTVKSNLIERKEIVREDGSIIPAGKWEGTPFGFELRKSSSLFLQKFLDLKARVFEFADGELIIFVSNSLMLIRIYKTHTELVCISTYEDKRGEHSGSFTMELLTRIADETSTILKLTTEEITGHGFPGIPQNPVIVQGIKPEGKIPAEKLEDWFEKFGFVKGKKHGYRDLEANKRIGYHMERQPLNK